jgi:hypothetical protein
MNRRKIVSLVGASALVLGAVALSGAGTASAAGVAAPKATGSVTMRLPLQAMSFSAFPATSTAPVKGSVTYTNFDYAGTSTVWRIANSGTVTFNDGVTDYVHQMDVTEVRPTATNAIAFKAVGVYSDPSYTWVADGTVVGTAFTMHVLYTGTAAGSVYDLVGTIAPDGSLTGTTAGLTWSMPAGSAYTVFSYTARVTSATVSGSSATFGYTVPQGIAYAGTPITVSVTDASTPALPDDTLAVNGGAAVITSGNIVVH